MTLLLKCSRLSKFVLFLPIVLLLSCSKQTDVDQTDPKAVAKLYLSSSYALKHETAYALIEPNFRKQVSVQAAAKELKASLGETPRILSDDISMEINIEGNKATVNAQFTLKPDNAPTQRTIKLVQIEGKWWFSPR